MTKEEILQLDRIEEYREGNQLEAKAAQGGLPDTLWDSYSAFANTDGGCILLGVKEHDDHTLYVVGLKDAEKMKKDFWNMVNNRQKISVNLMTKRRVRIEQGISDTQNGIVLKIFSLINYGERAGSGLNSIFHVWEHVYHTPAEINEEVGVDRVIVTLPMVGMNRM
jgi:predicted HTH transcriptional regulator